MVGSQTWFAMTIVGQWRQSRGQYGIDERKLVLKAKGDMVRLIYPGDPTDAGRLSSQYDGALGLAREQTRRE
jgi:hypothetical protein